MNPLNETGTVTSEVTFEQQVRQLVQIDIFGHEISAFSASFVLISIASVIALGATLVQKFGFPPEDK